MPLRTLSCLFIFCLTGGLLFGQSFSGTYADGVAVRLELNDDHTFRLSQSDPIFSYRFEKFQSTGRWVASGDTVWLNPDAMPRKPEVQLLPRKDTGALEDAITIQLEYFVEQFTGDSLLKREAYPIEQVTVFLDKRRRGFNLVQDIIIRRCAFAPRVKRQLLPDASGVFRLPADKRPQRIGVLTYGFSDVVWFSLPGADLNLQIVQPVEMHRTPRNKMVIMKKGKAYFYEFRGKVRTGGLLSPLVRVED